ncbi:MAG: hypothetical protein HY898_00210 [Deltaproteobacteria bacterium]|nr:hypothetical protein [Deltaproteobacteria bacterium]
MKGAWLILLVALPCCGSGNEKPPEPPKRASAQERILSVGKSWQEGTRSEGYVNTADIAFLRTTDKFTLHLTSGKSTGTVDLEREELIRTPQGREYHCTVTGAVQAVVKFSWRGEEAAVAVRVPASTHPRSCRENGYPSPSKQFDAVNAIYVLRGDQLVAVEPQTLRSSLLPAD